MGTLSENTIQTWIVPHLTVAKRGFPPKVPIVAIVQAILHRLKTGCQWRELPLKQFFGDASITWNGVFYHFNKWSKAGCWLEVWVNLLKQNRQYLDMSSVELDGSQTLCKNGGEAVGYQKRKSGETTNSLYLSDSRGIMLAMATPQEGQHHDLFEIKQMFEEICQMLKEAGIDVEGLFLNADPGFDSQEFKDICEKNEIIANIKPNPRKKSPKDREPYESGTHIFDEELYKDRTVIEHANAWMDAFKMLLVRFETTVRNWKALNLLAFSVIFLRRITKSMKV
jgi:transposase